jgi:hypothetical protein
MNQRNDGNKQGLLTQTDEERHCKVKGMCPVALSVMLFEGAFMAIDGASCMSGLFNGLRGSVAVEVADAFTCD